MDASRTASGELRLQPAGDAGQRLFRGVVGGGRRTGPEPARDLDRRSWRRVRSCPRISSGAVSIRACMVVIACPRALTAPRRAILTCRTHFHHLGGRLRHGQRVTGQHRPGGLLGVDRVGLAAPAAAVPVRPVDLDDLDALGA